MTKRSLDDAPAQPTLHDAKQCRGACSVGWSLVHNGGVSIACDAGQGIETVRRDNCQLVRTVVSTCLDKILIEEDIEGAKAYVRHTISDLLMNRLDLSLLVITKVSVHGILRDIEDFELLSTAQNCQIGGNLCESRDISPFMDIWWRSLLLQ